MNKAAPLQALLLGLTLVSSSAGKAAAGPAIPSGPASATGCHEQPFLECPVGTPIVIAVPPAAFLPRNGGGGYWFYNRGGSLQTLAVSAGSTYQAAVQLPTGLLLERLYMLYANGDSPEQLSLELRKIDPGVAYETLASVGSTPGTGRLVDFGYADVPDLHGFPGRVGNSAGAEYALVLSLPPSSQGLTFLGADIVACRDIAPASTPSFTDVGPADYYYDSVEAIYAAGITLGCGGGKFCPRDPVTRGQMAAFLSRALGLYWPY